MMQTIDEVVRDIHALEADLQNYERKYGILSETLYEAYHSGEEPADVPGSWIGEIGLERMKSGSAVAMNCLPAFSRYPSLSRLCGNSKVR